MKKTVVIILGVVVLVGVGRQVYKSKILSSKLQINSNNQILNNETTGEIKITEKEIEVVAEGLDTPWAIAFFA